METQTGLSAPLNTSKSVSLMYHCSLHLTKHTNINTTPWSLCWSANKNTTRYNWLEAVKLSPFMGMQADMGGPHFPLRHLDSEVLIWYPDSQKRRMVVLWGKPWHGEGSQRKPPYSGTRGWVQFILPAEKQNSDEKGPCFSKHQTSSTPPKLDIRPYPAESRWPLGSISVQLQKSWRRWVLRGSSGHPLLDYGPVALDLDICSGSITVAGYCLCSPSALLHFCSTPPCAFVCFWL